MRKRETIRLYRFSKLDAQWSELLNIYLARDKRVQFVNNRNEADFVVIDVRDLNGKTQDFYRDSKFIVLSFVDLGRLMLGLRPDDMMFREVTKKKGAEFFYLQGECSPNNPFQETGVTTFYDKDMPDVSGDEHMTVLTLPMGYVSGSKINSCFPDNDSTTYWVRSWKSNPKKYDFDWCWIGARSSRDRFALFSQLESLNGRHKFVISDMVTSGSKEERVKLLHADNKTVPYDEYLDYHRRSKVSISANGLGMWNYKDAEFMANNCFVLRQWHKNLFLNPWTPKDGVHWVVFKNDEVKDKIDYYVKNDKERETINDAGHEYFKWAIRGGWAEKYADMFLDYLNERPEPFRKAEYRGENSKNLG